MNVLVVTGAGVSAAAGLATFRTDGGIWADENFLKMSHAHHYGNYLDVLIPKWVELSKSFAGAEPTLFHRFVAEQGWRVVTQNVDGLHQKAGSQEVLEVHGSSGKWRCLRCKKAFLFSELVEGRRCPFCGKGKVRPSWVLFGEQVLHRKQAEKWVARADVVVFAGTSGNVYPVAEWYLRARDSVLVDPVPWGDFGFVFAGESDEWVRAGAPLGGSVEL